MKDFIWTLILVWLIYKLVDLFKSRSSKKEFTKHDGQQSDPHAKEADLKRAVQKHLNKEGEYVDFEELK